MFLLVLRILFKISLLTLFIHVFTCPFQGRLTTPLAITAAAAAVGSSFPHGFNTGVLNAPQHVSFLQYYSQKSTVALSDFRVVFFFSQGRVTIPLVIAAAVSIMSNSMPHGYNTGVLNAPQLVSKGTG